MIFNDAFDAPARREGSCCLKWDRCSGKFQEPDILPLWIADTDFACPPAAIAAMADRLRHPILGYSFAAEEYYTSIQSWFAARHGLTLERDWIRAACGVVTSISYAIQALTAPGDPVLIQPPVYDPFAAVIRGTGRTLVENPLAVRDSTYEMDFAGLEDAFRRGVKLMVLCNPHNPVGRVWDRDTLQTLVTLCVRYGVYLVSDEIHCDFSLFGHRYTSILAFPEIHPLAVVCIAPGKSFNLSGLSISSTVVPDPDLNQRLASQLHTAWLINPNVLGMVASAAAYSQGGQWMDAQLQYVEENSRLVQQRLQAEAPHIRVTPHQGTFLLWLDFRDFGLSDEDLAQELIHTWHLGMNEGCHYGPGGSGFMRLNIGCTRATLTLALDRLAAMHQAHFSCRKE